MVNSNVVREIELEYLLLNDFVVDLSVCSLFTRAVNVGFRSLSFVPLQRLL